MALGCPEFRDKDTVTEGAQVSVILFNASVGPRRNSGKSYMV